MKLKIAEQLNEALKNGVKSGVVIKDEYIKDGFEFNGLFILVSIYDRSSWGGKGSATVDFLRESDGYKGIFNNYDALDTIEEILKLCK